MIDVDPQHLAGHLRQVLAAEVRVGIARAVARRDVEHSVEAEFQIAAVMAVRFPRDDVQCRLRDRCVNVCAVHRVARGIRPLRLCRLESAIPADIEIAVVGKFRMKANAVSRAVAWSDEQRLGLLDIRIVRERARSTSGPYVLSCTMTRN